ncbi:hypothetical protein BDY19DRAFT_978169 [Irpex rosettiformis]|uniref:Uncharacterized protein n=1 Tax=Irpex rosettiformis TaxID=378272 RepID=A0ACB8TNC9_9APHY|nr:hypothetical protein BDY19DRAFT_978169 [Irpex rosettiformis]
MKSRVLRYLHTFAYAACHFTPHPASSSLSHYDYRISQFTVPGFNSDVYSYGRPVVPFTANFNIDFVLLGTLLRFPLRVWSIHLSIIAVLCTIQTMVPNNRICASRTALAV